MLSPAPSDREPDFTPAVLDNPRVGQVNPALRQRVHKLVETYPAETVRVIREWMAEPAPATYSFH